ncbi:unnamed protein product [Chironomus riparius]|uniref:TIL domain-containing protein n=1 Tax=Chironomus riparius TaxID=315576 RepID=A0A9N9RL85_9DIPT|nr:unnamed protein product [Chironomus riparius]
MKIIILLLISFIAFSKAIDKVIDPETLVAIRDPCPYRMNCAVIRIVCSPGTVFDMNPRGCCCKPLCTGQNEVYTCGCADKVCNEPQIMCIRCLNGCFCKPGFVRHPKTKQCIPEKLCPLALIEEAL